MVLLYGSEMVSGSLLYHTKSSAALRLGSSPGPDNAGCCARRKVAVRSPCVLFCPSIGLVRDAPSKGHERHTGLSSRDPFPSSGDGKGAGRRAISSAVEYEVSRMDIW